MLDQKYAICAFADEAGDAAETQIRAMRENGVFLLELRSLGGKNVTLMTNEEVRAFRAQLDAAGIGVWSIGSPCGKHQLTEPFAPQLDLRGKYGDEACEMVDKYIDDALRVGVKTIRIVHGKGTGVLRRRITEYLKTDKRVLSVRIGEWGEGDTGVSIAELR